MTFLNETVIIKDVLCCYDARFSNVTFMYMLSILCIFLFQVVYQEGKAVLLECSVRSVCESNPMLTCLQTRWPNIEILWVNGTTPSLN